MKGLQVLGRVRMRRLWGLNQGQAWGTAHVKGCRQFSRDVSKGSTGQFPGQGRQGTGPSGSHVL